MDDKSTRRDFAPLKFKPGDLALFDSGRAKPLSEDILWIGIQFKAHEKYMNAMLKRMCPVRESDPCPTIPAASNCSPGSGPAQG